jgi:hypothetical protein
MPHNTLNIAGIIIPNISPLFLAVILLHILVAFVCVLAGIIAMLSKKRAGVHSTFGAIYYWFQAVIFASVTVLSIMRWAEDYYLFILGVFSFAMATMGRMARRKRWKSWVKIHIAGMGMSYIFMLVAFYVDNGRNLPVWKDLPAYTYWLLPNVVGIPLIIRALIKYSKPNNKIS